MSPIPVPPVLAVDRAAELLVVGRVPDTSLLDEACPDPAALVDQLADFLSALCGVGGDQLTGIDVDRYPLADYRAELADALPTIAPALTDAQLTDTEAFVAAEPPAEPAEPAGLRFCHTDVGVEHLFAGPDRRTLTGVIDWSDAVVTDPARDLGRLLRDLGAAPANAILARLALPDRDAVWRRAIWYARATLLEDLAVGVATGDRRYLDAARGRFAHTFGVLDRADRSGM